MKIYQLATQETNRLQNFKTFLTCGVAASDVFVKTCPGCVGLGTILLLSFGRKVIVEFVFQFLKMVHRNLQL
jgi:hypothetical protein